MVTCSPPRLLLRVWGCSWCLTLDPAGWGWCLCQRLLFAPCSRWCLLSWWSLLRLRVFGGYWTSPLCFHDRRYDSRATCSALPPVSRLSFVLGEFSFWLGFGLCLTILLAPWGCQRAYCGPHCGRESARVLASLLGPSLQGSDTYLAFVPQLEALSESLTHSIPRCFLVVSLSAYAVGLADALWLCPERALRLFFASVSLVDLVALSPLSCRVFADGFRHLCALALAEGRLPVSWVPSEPLGVCGGSTYIALYRTW